MKKNIFIFAVLVLFFSFLHGSDLKGAVKSKEKTEKKGEVKKKRKKISLNSSLFLSYSVFKGNTNGEKYYGNGKISGKGDNFDFSLYYERNYGENNDVVNIDNGKLITNINHKLKDKISLNTTAIYETNAIVHLKRRVNIGFGLGYSKNLLKGYFLSLTGNLLYELSFYENSRDEERKNVRLAITFDNKLKFFENSEFETKVFYTPNLLDLSNDFRIEINSSLRVLMKEPLWFRFSLRNNFNNKPYSESVKKNDFSMLTGIEIII